MLPNYKEKMQPFYDYYIIDVGWYISYLANDENTLTGLRLINYTVITSHFSTLPLKLGW
jgi:hypothetical protein